MRSWFQLPACRSQGEGRSYNHHFNPSQPDAKLVPTACLPKPRRREELQPPFQPSQPDAKLVPTACLPKPWRRQELQPPFQPFATLCEVGSNCLPAEALAKAGATTTISTLRNLMRSWSQLPACRSQGEDRSYNHHFNPSQPYAKLVPTACLPKPRRRQEPQPPFQPFATLCEVGSNSLPAEAMVKAGATTTIIMRRKRDSNPRYPLRYAGFQDRCNQPDSAIPPS